MSIGLPPDRADVVETAAVQGVVTVGTTPVELKVGGSRLEGRQILVIYNDGSRTIYTGPSASVSSTGANKGMPLYKDQERVIPIGDLPIYGVTASSTSPCLVQEFS
jgi:hypothetical protein